MDSNQNDNARTEELAAQPARCPLPKVARRIGLVAILFFLIKGLLWLVVPALLVWWRR